MSIFKFIACFYLSIFFLSGCKKKCQEEGVFDCIDSNIIDKKSLIIGIDGLKSDALIEAETPAIDKLIRKGFYSYSANIDSTKSFSGPGWSSILTGVWYEKHLVNGNFFVTDNFETYPMFNCLLSKNQIPLDIEISSAWDELANNIENCDNNVYSGSDDEVSCHVRDNLANCEIDIVFAHFLNVDNRGHNFGFDASVKEYIDAIEKIDEEINSFLEIIEQREQELNESWLIVLCTDHGGVKLNESDQIDRFPGKHRGYGHLKEVSQVPLIFYNSNFNSVEITEEINIVDVVPTIFNWLELSQIDYTIFDGQIIELN